MAAFMSTRVVTKSAFDFLVKPVGGAFLNLSNYGRSINTEVEKGVQEENEEFRVYEIVGLKPSQRLRRKRRTDKRIPPPRFRSMPTDQDWTEVWPTVSTFNWSVVPFPVRQGFIESSIENDGVVPGKYANMELMKIPNFLHLTPNHIKKHCDALKQFCTPWPEELATDEKCHRHFPVEHITCDYLTAGPSQRDPRARKAVIKFQLSELELDYHAKDKFIRLVEHRYNPHTDEVVFESDRCPLKSQNFDFLQFVLTAVYFESWKTESWESLKQLSDMEKYFWDLNKSRQSLLSLVKAVKHADSSEDLVDEDALLASPPVQDYKQAVSDLFNQGEDADTLDTYKHAVKKVLEMNSQTL